jgi:hypothetical protein
MIIFIQSHALASMASTVARASVLIALVEILILMTVHSKQQHQRMKKQDDACAYSLVEDQSMYI